MNLTSNVPNIMEFNVHLCFYILKFIHSFNKHMPNIYNVRGIVLDAWDTWMNKLTSQFS